MMQSIIEFMNNSKSQEKLPLQDKGIKQSLVQNNVKSGSHSPYQYLTGKQQSNSKTKLTNIITKNQKSQNRSSCGSAFTSPCTDLHVNNKLVNRSRIIAGNKSVRNASITSYQEPCKECLENVPEKKSFKDIGHSKSNGIPEIIERKIDDMSDISEISKSVHLKSLLKNTNYIIYVFCIIYNNHSWIQ